MKEKIIDGRKLRYTIKWHYLCHCLHSPNDELVSVYDGHCELDAINFVLDAVDWEPIVFDEIIVEDIKND